MVSFFDIFKIFLKIGAILLGGGYVIIPIAQSELVEKRNWLTQDELCDYYCVSQCLPGIIAINMSILIGYKLAKIKGVFASTLGMAVSPFLAILLVANLIDVISNLSFIEGVFWGVNLSVIVLIYLAIKEMWIKSFVDKFSYAWFFVILILSLLKVSPVLLIVTSIVLGILIYLTKELKNVE